MRSGWPDCLITECSTSLLRELRATKPPEELLSALIEVPDRRPPTYLFHRGDYRQPKDAVSPADLTLAAPEGERFLAPDDDPAIPTTGRRLAYARHLMSGKHPMVSRVLMNLDEFVTRE